MFDLAEGMGEVPLDVGDRDGPGEGGRKDAAGNNTSTSTSTGPPPRAAMNRGDGHGQGEGEGEGEGRGEEEGEKMKKKRAPIALDPGPRLVRQPSNHEDWVDEGEGRRPSEEHQVRECQLSETKHI